MAKLEFDDSDQLKIGIKQSTRALDEGLARELYIARDADETLVKGLVKTAKEFDVPIVYIETMKELGKACKIDVGAATAVVLK